MTKENTAQGFSDAEFAAVTAEIKARLGKPTKTITMTDYGSYDVEKPEQYAHIQKTTYDNGRVIYRWQSVNEAGEAQESMRFSDDPLEITIAQKSRSLPNDYDPEEITINDPISKMMLTFDRIAVQYPRHFRINGKPADGKTVLQVPENLLVASNGNQKMTEDFFLEEALKQMEEHPNLLIEAKKDPQDIRETLGKLLDMQKAFNALGRSPS
jgi:hypothetical protein